MHPKARTKDLITTELQDELLVYDRDSDRALCLNATAAGVWRHADGTRTVEELAALLSQEAGQTLDSEVVWFALARLQRAGLLESTPVRPDPLRCTRRQLARRLGVTAAFTGLVPAITAIVAPTAAEAATCKPLNATCTSGAQCCSGRCHPILKRCITA